MSRLIETIRIENGIPLHLAYHQQRVVRSWTRFFDTLPALDLAGLLTKYQLPAQGVFKCRVIYSGDRADIQISPYEVRPIRSLRLVYDDNIEYEFKLFDRSRIEALYDQRNGCDDILIIRNGMVTDASYANIVFKDSGGWVTPSSCLLQGTQRQVLLDHKMITERQIGVKHLLTFTSFKLINAMLLFAGEEMPVSCIKGLK